MVRVSTRRHRPQIAGEGGRAVAARRHQRQSGRSRIVHGDACRGRGSGIGDRDRIGHSPTRNGSCRPGLGDRQICELRDGRHDAGGIVLGTWIEGSAHGERLHDQRRRTGIVGGRRERRNDFARFAGRKLSKCAGEARACATNGHRHEALAGSASAGSCSAVRDGPTLAIVMR